MLQGSVALITGGSRGIGRAVATRLHAEGMNVVVTARSAESLREVADLDGAGTGGRVVALSGDVTDPAAVDAVVRTAQETFGGIDLLVNNAGTTEAGNVPLWDADPQEWWRVLETNLRGPMLFSRAVVPAMVTRGHGRIININSTRSVRAEATQTAYGISKCAVSMLTQSLWAGLAGTGVCVFDYSPGRVWTQMTEGLYATEPAKGAWTPMEKAVEGLVAVAEGGLDELAGRFIHANDDLQQLRERAREVERGGGRKLVLAAAFPGDPLLDRIAGQRMTES
jgi:NAD(P)-dependent dehydrogenase (short-subunit alcohol dehydrogenase family)